jgi:ribosomal protein L9
VAGVGGAGQVVSVSAGHARNYLLPKRWAVPATDANKAAAVAAAAAAAEAQSRAAEAARAAGSQATGKAVAERVAAAEALACVARLTKQPLVLRVVVDTASGRAKQPVKAAELARVLRARRGVDLPVESLVLPSDGLTSLGEHSVSLLLDTRVVPGKHVMSVHVKKKL